MGICYAKEYTAIPLDESDVMEPPPSAFSSDDDSDVDFEVIEAESMTPQKQRRPFWRRVPWHREPRAANI
jgi:hypothetical protein